MFPGLSGFLGEENWSSSREEEMRETHFDIFYEGGELSASHFPQDSLETLVHSEFRSLLFLYSPVQI